MRTIVLLFTLIVLHTASAGQDHRISRAERDAFPAYRDSVRRAFRLNGIDQPPSYSVRAAAEWEEIDALVIAWTGFPDILREIVRGAQTECRVLIVCTDSTIVKNNLQSNGVPLTNIEYVVAPFNTIWCRDYGPWNVYDERNDSLYLIDWIYNRPRPKDDTVNTSLERYTSLPMYRTITTPWDLVHTGGNFMVDGMGTAFSSKLILDENPTHTEAEIDTILKRFMGINRYVLMDKLPYDQIHHIDMHLKLLDEETLLVGEYPPGIADGPQIEQNLAYVLSNYASPWGDPYRVVRIPMPPDAMGVYPNTGGDYRTYTNAVFVNRTVLLPFYDTQYDTTALRIWQEAMPGYRIVGIDCNDIIPSLGAIHCITKEIASRDPLYIAHQRIRDQPAGGSGYAVDAIIRHRSGIASATVWYRTDTLQPWLAVTMNLTNPSNNTWSCTIPAQASGSLVGYYIEATSNSGKQSTRPLPAPDAYWSFNVGVVTNLLAAQSSPGFTLFPNPASGICLFGTELAVTETVLIRTIDLTGRVVDEQTVLIPPGPAYWQLPIDGLPSGIYTVLAEWSSGSQARKLMINR